MELLLTAFLLSAPRALEARLLTAAVTPEELDGAIRDLREKLSRHAPLTMWATKQALHRLRQREPGGGEDLIATVYGSRDFREGVAAFLAKRRPQWHGT